MLGDHLDHPVGQIGDVDGLLVDVVPPGIGLVEHALQRHVRHWGDHVEQWRDSLADMGDEPGMLGVPLNPTSRSA